MKMKLTSLVKYPVTMGATTPGIVPNVLVIPRRNPAYLQEKIRKKHSSEFLFNRKTLEGETLQENSQVLSQLILVILCVTHIVHETVFIYESGGPKLKDFT